MKGQHSIAGKTDLAKVTDEKKKSPHPAPVSDKESKKSVPLTDKDKEDRQKWRHGLLVSNSYSDLAQDELQNNLVYYCKSGNLEEVKKLFAKGAKPDIPDGKNEQALAAAVWSMSADIVKLVLEKSGGKALMSWGECVDHNESRYKEIFCIPEFIPKTYNEWYTLLELMETSFQRYGDQYGFVKKIHMDYVMQHACFTGCSNVATLLKIIEQNHGIDEPIERQNVILAISDTEKHYKKLKAEIENVIKMANTPSLSLS